MKDEKRRMSHPLLEQVPAGALTRSEDATVPRRWQVDAVIPTYNRPADTARLMGDLAGLELPPSVRLRVVVVDNASETPASALKGPAGLEIEHFRLDVNRGGSGGFNAGIERVMRAWRGGGEIQHLVWLLDS